MNAVRGVNQVERMKITARWTADCPHYQVFRTFNVTVNQQLNYIARMKYNPRWDFYRM
jgi:hypothetical protein